MLLVFTVLNFIILLAVAYLLTRAWGYQRGAHVEHSMVLNGVHERLDELEALIRQSQRRVVGTGIRSGVKARHG